MRFLKKLGNGRAASAIRLLAALLLCSVTAAGCFATGPGGGQEGESHIAISGGAEEYEPVFFATKADMSVEEAEAVPVNLDEQTDECLIEAGGVYLLTGEMKGAVIIDAEEQITRLILDDVSISSGTGPAILVRSAGKVVITLKEGTENQLRDSGKYPAAAEENACIYSMCDLTINGSGSLEVYGYYKDGIHSRDVVKILGGQITIHAKRDGIRGNDGFMMGDGRLDIQSEGTGLRTTKSGRAGKGAVEISRGRASVIAGEYAVSAVAELWMKDCDIALKGILGDMQSQKGMYVQEECLKNE